MPQAGGSKSRGNAGGKNVTKDSKSKIRTPFKYPMNKSTGDLKRGKKSNSGKGRSRGRY